MARRNKHRLDEIKQMVLHAAETIIINEGYSALTARRIAMEIGYTVGSIYMVFANMADLIIHINARTVDDLTELMQQVPPDAPGQYITGLAKVYVEFADRNFNRWTMIFVRDTEIPAWYQQKIDRTFDLVETRFTQLVPGCSPRQSNQAARALWSGIHGICNVFLTGKQDAQAVKEIEDSVVLLVENFVSGWVNSLTPDTQK
ncbi:MAG: TetR/AcrR family transcriptional regulator [Methylobacter sp.]